MLLAKFEITIMTENNDLRKYIIGFDLLGKPHTPYTLFESALIDAYDNLKPHECIYSIRYMIDDMLD